MPIPYRKRKEYFRQYYQISKGVKSVKKGVKVNTKNPTQKLTPNLTPEPCPRCRTLAEVQKAYENLCQQLEAAKEKQRDY
jgi:hypothetical protein